MPLLRRLLPLAIVAASLAIPGNSAATYSAPSPGCAEIPTERDWVCPLQGSVLVKGSPLGLERITPLTKKRLTTWPGSFARLTFKGQANCFLGESSEIFPRTGRHSDALFSQMRGSASCLSSEPGSVRIACSADEQCPIEMRANGEFLFKSKVPPPARTSSVTTSRQLISIVSCSGFVEARVKLPGGSAHAFGTGTPGTRFVIVIRVVTRRAVWPWGASEESFAFVRSEGTSPGPADCVDSFVEEQTTSHA